MSVAERAYFYISANFTKVLKFCNLIQVLLECLVLFIFRRVWTCAVLLNRVNLPGYDYLRFVFFKVEVFYSEIMISSS